MSKRLNTSIKNADFATKKTEGYAGSDLVITKELLPFDEWDPEAISRRQIELSHWAFDIWSFPGEARPSAEDAGTAMHIESDSASLDQLPEIPT